MTKADFLSGQPFKYLGHFQTLNLPTLTFEREECQLLDNKNNEPWPVLSVNDDEFYVYKKAYGRVCIYYKECQLAKVHAS